MKIFIVENNFISEQNVEPIFSLRPETSLLRNNQSFFLPDFSKNIICQVSLVVRISRIGRCIYEKFANRYYEEFGAGVCFTAIDILEKLQKQNAATDMARCFDFSAAVSPDFIKCSDFSNLKDIETSLIVGDKTLKTQTSEMPFSIDKIVSQISQSVSFKIGDLIFVNPSQSSAKIKIGDKLQTSVNAQILSKFEIE